MPMILTAGFDPRSFARLAPLRDRYFPAHRNFIPVHLTLFQQLPSVHYSRVLTDLAARSHTPAPPFRATGIVDFGGGAAISIDAPKATSLHHDLRLSWRDILTEGDDRKRRWHVTVQNKVDRDTARDTQARLRAEFTPWDGLLDRLILWQYRGGPWDRIATVPLKGTR